MNNNDIMFEQLMKEYYKWEKESVIQNPVKSEEQYRKYIEMLKAVTELFGEEEIIADNPDTAINSHVIDISISTDRDIEVGNKKDKELWIKLITLSDYFQIGCTADGNTIKIDFMKEGIYKEA